MAKTLVGLDIGASGVRAVRLTRQRNGSFQVDRCAQQPLPHGMVVDGELKDSPQFTALIKKFWSKQNIGSRNVVVGVSAANVMIRQADVPLLPTDELKSSLRFHIPDVLPVPLDEVNLDFHSLGEFAQIDAANQRNKMLRILVAAAPKKAIDVISNALLRAGLQPQAADPSAFALIRLTRPSLTEDAPTEAIVDLGADIVTVIVHQGGQPRFVRTIPNYGGNLITQALMQRFKLGFDAAEALKRQVRLDTETANLGYASTESIFDADPARPIPAADNPALTLMKPWAAALVAEIRNSIDYFLGAYEGTRISRVVLVGGGAQIQGLTVRLASELRIPVEVIDPLFGMNIRRSAKAGDPEGRTAYAVATGLAMRG